MAAKNPKRVAAGKKAWRNRGKSKTRRRSSGGKNSRRKPIQRGIVGRVGAVVLGVFPVAISAADAVQRTISVKKSRGLSMFGAVHYGLLRFVSDLSYGHIGIEPFKENMDFSKEDGTVTSFHVTSGLPKGSLLAVEGTGLLMMAEDWVASKFAGGRPVKIPMTNYNAIGGS